MQDTQIAILKTHKRYIRLNNKHFRDLKFKIYLLCMEFHKFGVAILKILLFGLFIAKNCQKFNKSANFGSFLAIKRPISKFPKCQVHRDFQKIVTQASNNIFLYVFLDLLDLTIYQKNVPMTLHQNNENQKKWNLSKIILHNLSFM